MAGIAQVTAGDVIGRFANACEAVMAGDATAHHIVMVDGQDRDPTGCSMAGLAVIGTGNVICRFAVAVLTYTENFIMIHQNCWIPLHAAVAGLAHVGAGNMSRCFSRRIHTVVAGCAIAQGLGMIDLNDRFPVNG